MINFRYHIVSLMAVFLALSVGIVLGVTLRGPVDEGLVKQAATDRNQVTELRGELDRQKALDDYRDAWASRGGKELNADILAGHTVALITMPGAPTAVVNNLSTAVTDAGGTITHTIKVNKDVFDTTKVATITKALEPYTSQLQLTASMSTGTKVGMAVGRMALAKQTVERDTVAAGLSEGLTRAGLVSVESKSTQLAELAVVVTAPAPDVRPTSEMQTEHVQFDVALAVPAAGTVVAGPNSDNIDGTDVLSIRNDSTSVDLLSSVDVADLSSGIATTVLAGKEQLLGGQGHYGALTKADAPLPQLPVR